jgi:hypothetical protein
MIADPTMPCAAVFDLLSQAGAFHNRFALAAA